MLDAVVTQLQSVAPDRLVTRSLDQLFTDRDVDVRRAGVFTILMGSEGNFPNYVGREGQLGVVSVVITGQVELDETATGEDVENEELLMVDELKLLAGSTLPSLIGGLMLKNTKHSMQVDAPYGWIATQWVIE